MRTQLLPVPSAFQLAARLPLAGWPPAAQLTAPAGSLLLKAVSYVWRPGEGGKTSSEMAGLCGSLVVGRIKRPALAPLAVTVSQLSFADTSKLPNPKVPVCVL